MKIEKHGELFKGSTKKDKYEQFKCENCGCEFSVKEDEYYRDSGTNNLITTSTYTTWSPFDTLVCSCPECYKICKKSCYKTYNELINNASTTASKLCNCDASNETSTFTINNEVK